jgi:protein-L-isoaspartate(D-aspartate) O-methyltransferase
MDRLADFRKVFARVVATLAGCEGNGALVSAFAAVPRHSFVGSGPWIISEHGDRTSWDDPAMVYHDLGFGLLEHIPTGRPSLHAICLDACDVRPGARVVHVGAGSGYYTAILAELVGSAGRVDAYEVEEVLVDRAVENLKTWPWVRVHPRSAVGALPSPVDLIYVNAGVQQLPRTWIDSLADGGRLLVPLVPGTDEGGLFLMTREGPNTYSARFVAGARVVPCLGAEDDAANERLAAAFRRGDARSVRSLRLSDEPDRTAWFAGRDWWLSTAEA